MNLMDCVLVRLRSKLEDKFSYGAIMKIKRIIAKALLIMSLFAFLPFIFSQDNYAYASREELLNLEEEKSDIEDEIAERQANGESYDDLE
ncbi:hypothetical protein, partial [Phascolarctobacterium succinatutens]|uniref:hypothetical protein n=1 Tax=Phascolarctobacterium succinatutens TaxID=626940 RepID=UPI003FD77EB5